MLQMNKLLQLMCKNLSIFGIGIVKMASPYNQSRELSNVFLVPRLSANLVSVGQLVEIGHHKPTNADSFRSCP